MKAKDARPRQMDNKTKRQKDKKRRNSIGQKTQRLKIMGRGWQIGALI